MSTNRSPLKTANMAPPGGILGTQQPLEDNSESPENCAWTATGKDSRFEKQTKQYHLPHGYGYPPSQQPFPGAPQFYQHSPLNMKHSSQPTTSASQGYPSYGPQWQRYDIHQGGHGGSQMIPPPQIRGQGPSSPGAPWVPPGPLESHPVNWPTSSSPNPPPEHPSCAPRRPLISLSTKRFQPPWDPRTTDVALIAELPPLPEMSYNKYDADDESADSSDLGGAEVNRQSAWSKRNSPWGNFPKWWCRPTIVRSTSGRKYGWPGFWRTSIGPLAGGRTVRKMFEMDPCIGRWRLQIIWRHSRTGCHGFISIVLTVFTGRVWRRFWIDLLAEFGKWGRWESKATSD